MKPPGSFGNGQPKTPAWSGPSRTPNPYATEGRTPAWNAASRTPNPYAAADGGKTPAWNASSRTPNPYAAEGGRTPAWNTASRTPNPYASGAAATSSGWGGGATPKPTGGAWGDSSTSAGGWGGGGASPSWNQSYVSEVEFCLSFAIAYGFGNRMRPHRLLVHLHLLLHLHPPRHGRRPVHLRGTPMPLLRHPVGTTTQASLHPLSGPRPRVRLAACTTTTGVYSSVRFDQTLPYQLTYC